MKKSRKAVDCVFSQKIIGCLCDIICIRRNKDRRKIGEMRGGGKIWIYLLKRF